MNTNLDIVIFLNPITNKVEIMPVAMIGAYVPDATHLCLEEAAKVAAKLDYEAGQNLLLSIVDSSLLSTDLEDATGFDRLAVPVV